MTEIVVEDGAKVDHYRLLLENQASYHIAHVRVASGATRTIAAWSTRQAADWCGSTWRRLFDDTGSFAHLRGLYITSGDQHIDNMVSIDHAQAAQHEPPLLQGHPRRPVERGLRRYRFRPAGRRQDRRPPGGQEPAALARGRGRTASRPRNLRRRREGRPRRDRRRHRRRGALLHAQPRHRRVHRDAATRTWLRQRDHRHGDDRAAARVDEGARAPGAAALSGKRWRHERARIRTVGGADRRALLVDATGSRPGCTQDPRRRLGGCVARSRDGRFGMCSHIWPRATSPRGTRFRSC